MNPAWGDCNCECHEWDGVSHVAPCCYPDLDDPLLSTVSVVPVKEELEDLDRIDGALDDLVESD